MAWFQCEVCGDNIKKPKLPKHFKRCSSNELTCIDCGTKVSRDEVDSHTPCMTEVEKYGPAKAVNKKPKPGVDIIGLSIRSPWFCSLCNKNATSEQSLFGHAEGKTHRDRALGFHAVNRMKQTPGVGINVGLSIRPPWSCSLCNAKLTSKQALLDHAQGQKHRDRALGFHATNQKPSEANDLTAANEANETTESSKLVETGDQISSKVAELETDASKSTKKRKQESSDNEGAYAKSMTEGHETAELEDGEVTQVSGAKTEATKGLRKAKKSYLWFV